MKWQTKDIRKYKFNFIGNRNPQLRTEIISSINSYLLSQSLDPINDNISNLEILWIEYGDEPGEERGVPASEYMNYLSESDFTLCPPGYIKMTHRVIESLIRGSIPVLHEEELELYDINLQDRVNCVAVKNRNWIRAIKVIADMQLNEIHKMRYNISKIKNKYLLHEAFSHNLNVKMGIVKPIH